MSSMTQKEESPPKSRVGRSGLKSHNTKLAPGWSERILRGLEATQEQLVFGPVTLPVGLAGVLDQATGGGTLVLRCGAGADPARFCRALHLRAAESGSLFLRIDARSRASLAEGREIARRLRDHAQESVADEHREAICGSTFFVEQAEFLDDITLREFARLDDLRREGRPVPRLVLGFGAEVPASIADFQLLVLTPLAERPQDIVTLMTEILEDRIDAPILDEAAMAALRDHDWRGGERELDRVLNHLLLHFPGSRVGAREMALALDPGSGAPSPEHSLAELEEQQIYRVLAAHDWNRTRSSQILGIDVKTLYNKLKRYESRKRRLDRGAAKA